MTGPAVGNMAVVEGKDTCVAAGITEAPAGATWEFAGSQLHLKIPAGDHTVVGIQLWSGPKADLPKFAARLKTPGISQNPVTLIKGGPARWTTPVETKGTIGQEKGAYALDTIAIPDDNPWNVYMRMTGLDFFPDGRAAICTMSGDVWIVSGIDDKLDHAHLEALRHRACSSRSG